MTREDSFGLNARQERDGKSLNNLAGIKKNGVVWLLVVACALPLLAGCTTATGSEAQVILEITPVATPTNTPLAAPTSAPTTYSVKSGDTLSGIAAMFGVSVDDIVRVNNITDPNVLSDGQVLKIPMRAPEGTPTEQAAGSPSPQGSPVPLGSPTLPPPDVTPPLGPTTGVSAPGGSSTPGTTISPTAEP